MPLTYTKLRIFLASPSDVAADRKKILVAAEMLKDLADHVGLVIETVDWHDVAPRAGRPQQVIFDQLDPTSWDVFIGVLWHRFGTPPAAADPVTREEYLSGTEEEFRQAYELYRQTGRPQIMMYRCTRHYPYDVDLDQLKKVKDFFKEIENPAGKFPVLVCNFDSSESFEKMALEHLQKMLIEYGGQSKKTPISQEIVEAMTPTIPNNLPRQEAFFGRTKEIAEIMRALSPTDRTWGVLLDGIGGIGKTALAIETAYLAQKANLFEAFVFVSAKIDRLTPDGIQSLEATAHTLSDFLNETARIIGQPGITRMPVEDKRRALLNELKAHKTLLIYDNLETLSKQDQKALTDFLRDLPATCKAIITSRQRGGEGAFWLRVETLDQEAAMGIIQNEMDRDQSLKRKLMAGSDRWQQLYDETHGSPLALVHILGLMRVRATLSFDEALKMLRGAQPNNDLTHFIFHEAGKELNSNDKTALDALSFFTPTASLEAWTTVAGLSRNALEASIDRLITLSLVNQPAGQERYGLHPLIRSFIQQELIADTEKAYRLSMLFADFWKEYAEQYGNFTKDGYKTYEKLEAEWPNLQAAANWLWEMIKDGRDLSEYEELTLMLNDMTESLSYGFLFDTGRWDEMMQWESRAYEALKTTENFSEISDRAYNMAWLHHNLENIDESLKWINICLVKWFDATGSSDRPDAFRMKGFIEEFRGNIGEAEKFFKKALTIYRNEQDESNSASIYNDLGDLERTKDNLIMAEKYYNKSQKIYKTLDHKEGQGSALLRLGCIAFDNEQYPEARDRFQAAISLMIERGRQDTIAEIKHNIARTLEEEGKPSEALPLAQEALKIYQRMKHPDIPNTQELVTRLQSALEK